MNTDDFYNHRRGAEEPRNIFDDDAENIFGENFDTRRRGGGFGAPNDFEDGIVRGAKRTFSRYGFALVLYTAVAYAIVLIVSLILANTVPNTYLRLSEQIWFQWLMGVGTMYFVGFPLLLLIVKGMDITPRKARRLDAKEFFALLLVSEAFMYIGNMIGTSLNGVIGAMRGDEVDNSTSELIESSPIWLIFLIVVIIAPVIEELIFRKLLIDRISKYGDKTAIIVSAVAFGLFHGNFYQFFYAALLGLVLGYMYTRTGKVHHTILMHAVINFFGSIAALPIIDMQETLTSGQIPETAEEMRQYMTAAMGVGSYALVQYAMVIAGIVILIYAIRNRLISVNKSAPVRIPEHRVVEAVLANGGTITFIVMSLILFGINIFL